MSHFEYAALELKGAVNNMHDLQPVPITNFLRVQVLKEREDLFVLDDLRS